MGSSSINKIRIVNEVGNVGCPAKQILKVTFRALALLRAIDKPLGVNSGKRSKNVKKSDSLTLLWLKMNAT